MDLVMDHHQVPSKCSWLNRADANGDTGIHRPTMHTPSQIRSPTDRKLGLDPARCRFGDGVGKSCGGSSLQQKRSPERGWPGAGRLKLI